MVVPAWHVEFLKQPLSFWLATASLGNIPEPIKCTGIVFHPEKETFTCYAPKRFTDIAFEHIKENPLMALVAVELHTYEGYQYKGPYVSHRDCTREEMEFQHEYMNAFTDILESFGYSGKGFYNAYFHSPVIAIDFQVSQVFDQSPKVGTGGEIGKGKS